MPTLKQAQKDPKAMKQFLAEHDDLNAPKGAVSRYIDASAKPLDKPSKGHSSSNFGLFRRLYINSASLAYFCKCFGLTQI